MQDTALKSPPRMSSRPLGDSPSLTYLDRKSTRLALTNNLIDGKDQEIISFIEGIYASGADLKLFMDQYTDFILDLCKYCLFGNTDLLSIPASYGKELKFTTSIDSALKYFNWMSDAVMALRFQAKGDSMAKDVIEVGLLRISHMEGYKA